MNEAQSARPIRGVLFDLDGTLLDTLEDIGSALNYVLAARRWPVHPLSDYRQFVGDGVRMLVERAMPHAFRQEGIIEEVLREYGGEYARRWNAVTRPYPGIPPLLGALTAAGIPLSILSNKPHDLTVRCARHFFPETPFVDVRGQREADPRKPDPSVALEMARHMGQPADRIAMVGDSGVDMQTARAAGMKPIGVLWGFRGELELMGHGAETVVASPEDLRHVLLD
ncbi:MAG: HAD family hydrolase [Kiritimatiellae bacterium]|nr:HAD family hydrolase [Kiritimatiellia bacterium]